MTSIAAVDYNDPDPSGYTALWFKLAGLIHDNADGSTLTQLRITPHTDKLYPDRADLFYTSPNGVPWQVTGRYEELLSGKLLVQFDLSKATDISDRTEYEE